MENIIKVECKNLQELTDRYLKLFKTGGIIFSHVKPLELNDSVLLLLDLLWLNKKYAISGKVAYFTNKNNQPQDIAISFNADHVANQAKLEIEDLLGANPPDNNLLIRN